MDYLQSLAPRPAAAADSEPEQARAEQTDAQDAEE
jgi:hypothetical protein